MTEDAPIKILLIEDDEDDYLFLNRLLQKLKIAYTLEWAASYQKGKEAIQKNGHDIYIVDYRLGESTGLELIRQSQSAGFDQPFILLTGLGDENLGVKALRAGAEDYLIKGEITPAILERSIRYALERKETSRIRESEQALKEREQYFAGIVSTLAEGVIIFDAEGRVQTANQSAQKILGFTFDQLKGKIINVLNWNAIHEDGTPFPASEYPSSIVLKTHIPQTNVVMGIQRTDGELIWILANSTPLYKKGEGKPYAIVGSFIDITSRKKLEQQKDQFISTASHELKTPVTSLKLFTELLHSHAQKIEEPTVQEYASIIMTQANRLVALLNDLLDVSRIEAGRLELQHSDFDINELMSEIIHQFKHIKKSKHEIEYKSTVTRQVNADRDRIFQVMTNLVSNALKYSPQAEKITIEVKEHEGKAEVVVQDYGFGIPEEEQKKMFERFFRTREAHNKNIPGFGLGLHITREIVKRHGSDIKLMSKPGEGSTFSFTLKLRD